MEKAKVYQVRLLPDPNDIFYKTYFYHFFTDTQQKSQFVFCPKTWGMDKYCPFCAASMRLHKSDNKQDKSTGYLYRRQTKHCANIYVVKDPRDAEAESEEAKSGGKVLVYEFPNAVESKLKQEMNDDDQGLGLSIFDPGEEGHDFVLKVRSTKPIQQEGPNQGKQFPDYSDSKFAPRPSAIGTDEEIEQIMESRHDLVEYLKTMQRSDEQMLELIKKQMLYEVVEQDYEGSNMAVNTQNTKQDKPATEQMDDLDVGKEEPKEKEPQDIGSEAMGSQEMESEDISEEDLMEELENL
ncbi:MAG: hypothetical protein ACOC80_16570 [Petrotogales bacterium]